MDPRTADRLENARNIWVATVRPDGRPHLTPVWFVLEGDALYICISPRSVKARNLSVNPKVACALEDGDSPVICEGAAAALEQPWPEAVRQGFKTRYDWDIATDSDYGLVLEIRPEKWLTWNDGS